MAKKAKKTRGAESACEGTITTAIHIRRSHYDLLRAVAFARAQRGGGRISVSKVVSELVSKHERELRKEAGRYLELMNLEE